MGLFLAIQHLEMISRLLAAYKSQKNLLLSTKKSHDAAFNASFQPGELRLLEHVCCEFEADATAESVH